MLSKVENEVIDEPIELEILRRVLRLEKILIYHRKEVKQIKNQLDMINNCCKKE